jgi:hypothetical protein
MRMRPQTSCLRRLSGAFLRQNARTWNSPFHDEHRAVNQRAYLIVRKPSRILLLDGLSDPGMGLGIQPQRLDRGQKNR